MRMGGQRGSARGGAAWTLARDGWGRAGEVSRTGKEKTEASRTFDFWAGCVVPVVPRPGRASTNRGGERGRRASGERSETY